MTVALKNFIGGEWVDGSGITKNINPSNTKDVVGEYAKADKAQTEKAIAAAKAAFPAWSRGTPQERYDALNKISTEILARKEELGTLLAREEGKTKAEGIGMGWVSILNPRRIAEILDVPPSWRLMGYFCLGYPLGESKEPELEAAKWEQRLDPQSLIVRR